MEDCACSADLSSSSNKATVWTTIAPFPSSAAARDASTTSRPTSKASATTPTASPSHWELASSARLDSHLLPTISAPSQQHPMELIQQHLSWAVMWLRMEHA